MDTPAKGSLHRVDRNGQLVVSCGCSLTVWMERSACATSKGQEGIVKRLLENKGDVNSRDANGRTPLSKAASEGRVSVVRVLLDSNADPSITYVNGDTPLHRASHGGHLEAVNMFFG